VIFDPTVKLDGEPWTCAPVHLFGEVEKLVLIILYMITVGLIHGIVAYSRGREQIHDPDCARRISTCSDKNWNINKT
jgi:hypothetical protein